MAKKKIYIKDESADPIYKARNNKFLVKSRVLPSVLIFSGCVLLVSQVILPLVYFKSTSHTKPMESSVLGTVSGFKSFEFEELHVEEAIEQEPQEINIPEYFYLTVPKLRIENAAVEVNSPTLSPDDALGHYTGTAIPGQVGNSFIYGHSVLPWFYNPKNYKTIFSTLEDLDTGDRIYIDINNERLTYIVENKETLYPGEVNPLAETKPAFLNESTITLMTCVPPGTKIQRLLVHAVLR